MRERRYIDSEELFRLIESDSIDSLIEEIDRNSGVVKAESRTEIGPIGTVFLFSLDYSHQLSLILPPQWFEPAPTKLKDGRIWPGGLPRNLWLGTKISSIVDVGRLDKLQASMARIRFVERDGEANADVAEHVHLALQSWRCRICGDRGAAPRPDRCKRWKLLCSEGSIIPQIEWVIDKVGDVTEAARAAGCVVAPDVPTI